MTFAQTAERPVVSEVLHAKQKCRDSYNYDEAHYVTAIEKLTEILHYNTKHSLHFLQLLTQHNANDGEICHINRSAVNYLQLHCVFNCTDNVSINGKCN